MIRVHVHTPIRGRADAGDTIELDEATVVALEALGAVARVKAKEYQAGAGPADPEESAMAPSSGEAGKAAGAITGQGALATPPAAGRRGRAPRAPRAPKVEK